MEPELPDQGDFIPAEVTAREVKDEACRRARDAGYPVTRDGRRPPRAIHVTCNWGRRRINGRLVD